MTLPVHRHRPLAARDPLAKIDELFERMGTLLESTVDDYLPTSRSAWSPLADLRELEDAYVIEAELPGIKREDIDVEIGEDGIVISGETREEERKGTLHRGTRRTGRFEYRATLPGRVDADGAKASLEGGVLTVRLPKAEDASTRHVDIEGG